jgi:polyisoprenoid-binding protein YceI
MMDRYRFDPGNSRFTVQAFAGGLLSFVAHSPTFAVRDFAGEVRFDPEAPAATSLWLTVRADSLDLLDPVKPADREEIEGRMRREVLQAGVNAEIHFEADDLTGRRAGDNGYQVRLHGRLTLHGVVHPHDLDAELLYYPDGVRLSGETILRLSDYNIRPVTALGGTIRLRDELRLAFDLVAWKEGQATP